MHVGGACRRKVQKKRIFPVFLVPKGALLLQKLMGIDHTPA